MNLPTPECRLGYTHDQVQEIVGERSKEFWHWMRGQTMAVCQAEPQRKWVDDPDAPGGMRIIDVGPPLCGVAHGAPIVYPWDIERFLMNLPIID